MFEERRGTARIVHVQSDLDIASGKALTAAIATAERATHARIVVSLETCAYCDSAGLSTLIQAHKRLGRRLFVVVPECAPCRRIFDIMGMASVLHLFGSLEEALALTYPD